MELSNSSLSRIEKTIREAIAPYADPAAQTLVTDIHLQPLQDSGKLTLYDDEDKELGSTTVNEWEVYPGDDFYSGAETVLTELLHRMQQAGDFEHLSLVKPFSFVLIDNEKETLAELLLIDDDTLLLTGELLKGLDEELDAFLKELLEK